MRVLSTTTIFPGSETPGQGVFIKERLRGLPPELSVEALRLRPWFPLLGLVRPGLVVRPPREETVDGIRVHDRRFFYLPGILKSRDGDALARALSGFLRPRRSDFDLIDAHFVYPTGYGAVRVGRELDLPVCVTLRGTLGSYAADGRRPKLIECLRRADRLIAVSNSLAALAREMAGDDLDIRVIGNGIDRELFSAGDRSEARRRLGLEGAGPILLTVGGLVPRKGVHRVLEVLPALLETQPDLRYLVVGGGGVEGDHRRRIESMIAERDLGSRVSLLGQVSHDRLADYYRAADLFVLATANEGWANALQEALACGCPVVTTDVGGNREVVGEPANGLVVPFGDPAALESALIEALGARFDRELIAGWGGRRDWGDVGRETAEVFGEIV